jgi:hypothetical protein
MTRPHIQVILADNDVPETLRAALERVDATASFSPLSEAARRRPATSADALVMVVPEDTAPLAGPIQTVFERLAERPRATLVISPRGGNGRAVRPPPTVPVSFGADLTADGITARLGMMLEMRPSLDELHREAHENYSPPAGRYAHQLRLASQVQREFLPASLPRFGNVSFDLLFRPVDYVSGDIYDVHHLDAEHVGIAVADASGHGIPAALLTVYIKRALRGRQFEHGAYRILQPDEVLAGLNADILDANLTECPFVAAVYAVLNTRTLELTLARGGAPYPLYRAASGTLKFVRTAGALVGVSEDAQFPVSRLQIRPGDSLLLYTDGLERIVDSSGTPRPPGAAAFAATPNQARTALHCVLPSGAAALPDSCPAFAHLKSDPPAVGIESTSWWKMLRDAGPTAALEHLSQRQRALRRMGYPLDDLTALVLHVDPPAPGHC